MGLPWEVGVGDSFPVLELPLAEVTLDRHLPLPCTTTPNWKILLFLLSLLRPPGSKNRGEEIAELSPWVWGKLSPTGRVASQLPKASFCSTVGRVRWAGLIFHSPRGVQPAAGLEQGCVLDDSLSLP